MKNWSDIYALPFDKMLKDDNWVYDSNNNFIFQFEVEDEKMETELLYMINGKIPGHFKNVVYKDGEIHSSGEHLITIRGWGNLTSPVCLNLSHGDASTVEDTLADYIVSKISKPND